MEPKSHGMTPFEELLEETFLSYLKTEIGPEKKKNSTISFTTSVRYLEEDISGCQELKADSFSSTVTFRDGEIVSVTTSHSPSINSWKEEE